MSVASPVDHYRLLGGPGSPYSLKIRAVLRYRHLPHRWIVPRGYIGAEGELAQAGKGVIPVLQYPDGRYRADSTPMILDLEVRHPGHRSVVPDDRATAFLSHLIEDMGDEMLVNAMFDLRWRDAADQKFCAIRQMYGWLGPCDSGTFEATVDRFIRRQTRQRERVVGASGHEGLMTFYKELLRTMEQLIQRTPFIFGSRPALADFGLYGQLSQCAIDPSASELFRSLAPRTYQWTQSLDDASGVDGHWAPRNVWEDGVRDLLGLVGTFHLPLLQAHHDAVEHGQEEFEMDCSGMRGLVQASRYKHKCLVWLQRHWQALSPDEKRSMQSLLQETGCLPFLNAGPTARVPVPEMAPL